MKKIISIIILSMFFGLFTNAQYLINQGADIVISSGSSLVIDGDFVNQLDGSLGNSGDIFLTGDFTNNATSGALLSGTSGTVRFIGSSPQNIAGTAVTYFNNLDLQNDANLTASVIALYGDLQLSNTYLGLGSGVVVMQPGTQILGASSSGYIITNGNGFLRQYVFGSDKVFPIGTSTNFAPVTLNNAGTADYYSARVFSDVRVNGTTGATIPGINDCVNMTWDINDFNAGGSDLTVTPFWSAAMEGVNFDRAHCAVGHYTGGAWNSNGEGAAAGAGPYSITRSGITALSAFAVGDLESQMAIPLDIRLDAYAFLEGPFNGTHMDSDIATDAIVPLTQPFGGFPWFYGGGESVLATPAGAVDWILLELRDAVNAASATPATTIAKQAAFVLEDGTIVALDGTIPTFTGIVTNNLFVVVYHRNHIPIMSANAVAQIGGIYTYDFTTSVAQVYGGAIGHKQIASGVWGMFSGNADGDNFIDFFDRDNEWALQSGSYGYLSGDMNLDGQVDNADKNDHWHNNNGEFSQVPN